MKKIFLTFFIFGFMFCAPVSAETVILTMPTGSLSPTPLLSESVEYELPYPGILPGTPLYALKTIRDRIKNLFITDPLNKSNFCLLQADKKLAAAIVLYENDNAKLGEETLALGINNLDKSLDEMIKAKKTQANIMDIYAEIKTSTLKHEEEVKKLIKESQGTEREKLIAEHERILRIQKKVNSLNP